MKAILSTTDNPLYSFFLPIVTWSWKKLGIDSIVFIPEKQSESFKLAKYTCPETTRFETLNIEPDREPTYFQCVRLYAAALPYIEDDEVLITSDIDMAVFNTILSADSNKINIAGHDLTPEGQYPMCYVSMRKTDWRNIMSINGRDYKYYLSELLDNIQCENMRGNYWGKDQGTIWEQIQKSGREVNLISRAQSKEHQIATRRADRDGWRYDANTIIDAHLPRPGYDLYNFNLILKLFKDVYSQENFGWMMNYRNAYLTLL